MLQRLKRSFERAWAKFALPKTMLADGFYFSGVPQFSGML